MAIAFVFYASLIPFRLTPVPLGDAFGHYVAVMFSPSLDHMSRTNFLANLLLAMPVGFGLAGARLCDRGRRWSTMLGATLLAVLAGVLVAMAAEFLQEFAPGRVPAQADVEAQAIGCLAGVVAWLVAGPALTDWLRMAQLRRGHDRLGQALVGYTVAWVAVNLAPFDVTFDLGELSQRVHAGLITVVPFVGTGQPVMRVMWEALITALSATPLGALGVVVGQRDGRARGPIIAFLGGAALVAGIEGAQIFIVSHAADVTDVLSGCAGVALGVAVARRLRPSSQARRPAPLAPSGRGAALLLAGWVVVLVLYHWMPYDFTADRGMIRGKLAGLSLVPFGGYVAGSDLNALNDILTKLGLAAPLGVLAAYVRRRRARPVFTLGVALAAATALFVVVESGQLFLPNRTPDPTDVALGVAGAMGGLWLGRWIRSDG